MTRTKARAASTSDGAKQRPPAVLREHALLADGERGALIDPNGDVRWLCAPRWQNEPVFSGLLGGPGRYSISPRDSWHTSGGFYEPASLVWHSRWITSDSVIESDAALAYPADVCRVVLLRTIRAIEADAAVLVELDPSAGFSHGSGPQWEQKDGVWVGQNEDLRIRWQGGEDAQLGEDGVLRLSLDLPEGQEHHLVLELAREDLPDDAPDPHVLWPATRAAWERCTPDLPKMAAEDDVRMSYAVLAGLTSTDHGMVAAATMSLPERARQGENYDYRYAWIRDQCYAGEAVAAIGPHRLLDSALTFVTDRLLEDGADLKPAYTVDGQPVPDQTHVDLPGYPGGGNIVGNWVNQQFQLDALGEALSLYAAAARLDQLDARAWQAVRTCVEVIESKQHDPDAGIWELDNDSWTQSRLACVAGLRSIARHTHVDEAARWVALADSLLSETAASSLHASGRWQQSPSRTGVDASLLLPPVRGALSADDPRTVATRQAVAEELTSNGHVYRFRHDGRPLADTEGSFTLCGFMMALAQAHAGHSVQAMHYYERARSTCSTSGLFTEEYDTRERQLRGNLPQAFVHAMFIEATARVDQLLRSDDASTGELE